MIHPKASTAALGKREPEALVDIDSDKGLGGGCKPWLKVSRDQEAFEACMAIAEKIGPIDTPKKAFEILKEAIGAEDQEVFGAMYLDTHLYLRGLAETGRGEYDAVMAPLKPTLRLALAEGITGVLVFHCHPTLYSQASDSDIEVTKMFEKACATLDLFFVDHLIVGGRKEFFSFADEGYLK
jgi:DNA repair protein RadC